MPRPVIKPPALKKGEKVGIVAPASSFNREHFEAGCAKLRQLGYEPVYSESIFDRDLYFAGSARRRAQELESMFAREDIKAILCVRGGYGANYLLPLIDMKKLAAHPKIFVGCSDVTCLLTSLYDAMGLITFHGPMVAGDFARPNGLHIPSWQAALESAEAWKLELDERFGVKPLVTGTAEGVLYGGCLSILVASIGTPYEIDTDGTILFLEDVNAKPYQIDRMLMQLKLAGKLKNVRAIIFGEMLDCVQAANQSYTLEEVIMRVVGDLGVPIAFGLRSGHVTRENITLPFGIPAALRVEESKITIEFREAVTT